MRVGVPDFGSLMVRRGLSPEMASAAIERMKGMRDTHKTWGCDRSLCILNFGTSDWNGAALYGRERRAEPCR